MAEEKKDEKEVKIEKKETKKIKIKEDDTNDSFNESTSVEEVYREKNIIALLGFIFSVSIILVVPGFVLSLVALLGVKKKERAYNKFALPGLIISGAIILLVLVFFMFKDYIIKPKPKLDEYAYSQSELYNLEYKYYGEISFSSIYAGANCLTGMQTKKIQTEKYGEVTVEFSYCKSNNSTYLHMYN